MVPITVGQRARWSVEGLFRFEAGAGLSPAARFHEVDIGMRTVRHAGALIRAGAWLRDVEAVACLTLRTRRNRGSLEGQHVGAGVR